MLNDLATELEQEADSSVRKAVELRAVGARRAVAVTHDNPAWSRGGGRVVLQAQAHPEPIILVQSAVREEPAASRRPPDSGRHSQGGALPCLSHSDVTRVSLLTDCG